MIEALHQIGPLWDELFPAEQARIVRLLIKRIDVGEKTLKITLRAEGISGLVAELGKIVDSNWNRRAA